MQMWNKQYDRRQKKRVYNSRRREFLAYLKGTGTLACPKLTVHSSDLSEPVPTREHNDIGPHQAVMPAYNQPMQPVVACPYGFDDSVAHQVECEIERNDKTLVDTDDFFARRFYVEENPEDIVVESDDDEYEDGDEQHNGNDKDRTLKTDKALQAQFKDDLAMWAVKHDIKSVALNDLLAFLRQEHDFLPKDNRTLKNTIRRVQLSEVSGGQYVYLGVAKALRMYIDKSYTKVPNTLTINVNVDGIPLFKSSGVQAWPILCSVNGCKPIAVSVWCGPKKPHDVSEYLRDFVSEMKVLMKNGLHHLGVRYQVKIGAFVCDAPARAFLKCIVGHTGYNCCERCEAKGEYHGSVRLLDNDAPLRTNENFAADKYQEHQHGVSPLTELGVPMVNAFVLDYMHLVCQGVMKRLLHWWKDGDKESKWSPAQCKIVSDGLLKLKSHLPKCFQRRPRSLEWLHLWKATEYRFFLLYGGMIVLRDVLPKEKYEHFVALSVAIRILLSPKMVKDEAMVKYARELLIWFVKEAQKLYGKRFITYNVHSLLHLADDVMNHQQPLDKLSAFMYESYLGQLKRKVHSGYCPVQQLVKRLHEQERYEFEQARERPIMISTKEKESVYLMSDGTYVCARRVHNDGFVECSVVKKVYEQDLFEAPLSSSDFDVVTVPSLSHTTLKRYHRNKLINRGMLLPTTTDNVGEYVLVPLASNEG